MEPNMSRRLEVVEQVVTCTACKRVNQATSPVALRGDIPASVAVIGGWPSQAEDDASFLLQGPAGDLLWTTLDRLDMHPELLVFLNAVSCFGLKPPTEDQVDACAGNRNAQLRVSGARFALLLGSTAAKAVCGRLELKYGHQRPFEMDGVVYMATYDPAAAIERLDLRETFVADLRRFSALIRYQGNWMDFIQDGCAACAEEAEWYARSGLGFCAHHLRDNELEAFIERQRLLANDFAEVKARLGESASSVWQQTMDDARATKAAGGSEGTDPKMEALEAILWCAHHYPEFTADEVWARLDAAGLSTTHEPMALSPVLVQAAQQGWITNTRMTRPSIYPRRHRDLSIWESLVVNDG